MVPPEEARERGSWLRFRVPLVVLDNESILVLSSRLASIIEEDTEAVVDPLFPSSSS